MSDPVQRIPVWDPLVRLLHWTLVIGFFTAWFTRDVAGSWHEILGYVVLSVVLVRAVWGFLGTPYARFTQFLTSPGQTLTYARDLLRGKQQRFIGHNPLGGWMTVTLLIFVFLTCLSGWLYTTDRYWGVEWVEDLHELLTNITLGLIAVHVSGVLFTSFHDRENLVASMLHGKKRCPDR